MISALPTLTHTLEESPSGQHPEEDVWVRAVCSTLQDREDDDDDIGNEHGVPSADLIHNPSERELTDDDTDKAHGREHCAPVIAVERSFHQRSSLYPTYPLHTA
jgi:hypothetical protein